MTRALLNEELHTAEWLSTVLEAIPNLGTIAPAGAWLDLIPMDKDLPGIRYQCVRKKDVSGAMRSDQRIMIQLDWLVAGVVAGGDLIPLVPIADAIDVALQGQSGVTSKVEIFSCLRLETYSMTEAGRSGVLFRHAGGVYRTLVVSL